MQRNTLAALLLGTLLGLGIAFAGFTVASAVTQIRESQRYVTVKGLAERDVDADLAIWPVTFKDTGDDLADLQRRVDAKRDVVAGFLVESGFPREEVSFAVPRIQDRQTENMGQPGRPAGPRYLEQATVIVRSKNVAAVKKAMDRSGQLVGRGVMLAQDWENRPQFLFTGLNAIKPEMIEQATVSAREAAAKFAKDSGSKVGKIRSASQGLFTVTDRDPNSPERKVVRVVTTVEYFLGD
jgi:uncharacterized protein